MMEAETRDAELDEHINQVSEKLHDHGIDPSAWGSGIKNIKDLTVEIMEGESELKVTPSGELIRQVNVVKVDVRYIDDDTELQLVEDRQESKKDGAVWRRNFVGIREKIKSGEDVIDAAIRGLAEEIGVNELIGFTETEKEEKVIPSPSYPGLNSHYIIHGVQTYLPDSEFNEEGYIEDQDDKKTFFVWVEADNLK